jgi:hypothetical protein
MIVRPLCLAALSALVLASCQDEGAGPVVSAAAAPAPAIAPTPPLDGYVGRWAVTNAMCREGAWRFERSRLTTAGEVACDVADVEQGAASWALDVACTAEGQQAPGRLTLALVDPADPNVMTVQGGPFAGPVTLTRCNA